MTEKVSLIATVAMKTIHAPGGQWAKGPSTVGPVDAPPAIGGQGTPVGLVDHHVHFLSTAAARLSVDVSAARSLADIEAALRAAPPAPGTGWIRAWGYDETRLAEARHPAVADLDRGRPDLPVVLHHRTGHVAVLNSAALRRLCPPGGAPPTGGVLFDRHDLLARVPRLDPAALRRAAGQISAEWSARGIDAFVDATVTNGPAELDLLAGWCRDGVVGQRVTAMVDARHLDGLPPHGASVGRLTVGHAKIVPGPDLAPTVEAAHAAGYPVAVHVTEVDVLEATLEALARSRPPRGTTDRIEHAALSLPDQVARIAAVGAAVVVNPSFLIHRRPKYERELEPVERQWLIRIRSFLDAGVHLRAGSDSPVTPAVPAEMMAAATAHPFSPEESVDPAAAAGLLRP